MIEQTPRTDWRLERIIAILLSLLFLLPFVAQARSEDPTLSDAAALLLIQPDSGELRPALAISSEIRVAVQGTLARGWMRQRFMNHTPDCVEGMYVVPLPDRAAVDALRVRVGARTIEGVIREKAEARAEYEAAKRDGRQASLLEQFRPDVFRISVASILPGEEAEVEIEWQQTVSLDAEGGSITMPVAIAPRFEPSPAAAMKGPAVPESSALPAMLLATSAAESPHITIDVIIESPVPLLSVESPTHPEAAVEMTSPSKWNAAVQSREQHREFRLDWRFTPGSETRADLVTGEFGGTDYSILTLVPPSAGQPQRLAREVIFVIDRSGSMYGPALEQAKGALRKAIESLTPLDRHQVIAFSDTFESAFEQSEVATEDAKRRSIAYVDALHAEGGTMMLAPLVAALDDSAAGDDVRQIIFATDGQVDNENEVLAAIQRSAGRSRIYTLSLGPAPNSSFLRQAARTGRGFHTAIPDLSLVESSMTRVLESIEMPVLTNISITGAASGAEIIPANPGDLHAGQPLIISVKGSAVPLTVHGRVADREWSQTVQPHVTGQGAGVARLWARHAVELLEDSLVTGADPKDVREQVLKVALSHGISSSFTSLIAVDTTPASERRSCRTVQAGSATPDGWRGSLPATGTDWRESLIAGVCLLIAGVILRRGVTP